MNRTRGKPPVGTYVGKALGPVQLGQRESKKGEMYTVGNMPVHVKGGSGPVEVDGEYEFGGLSYDLLDFFRGLKEGDTFLFTVYIQNGYPKLGGLTTQEEIEKLMGRFQE